MTPQEKLVEQWESYLQRHPDYSQAATLRQCINHLKKANIEAHYLENMRTYNDKYNNKVKNIFGGIFG